MPTTCAIATAAKCGVLIERPDVVEALPGVRHVAFDKTGPHRTWHRAGTVVGRRPSVLRQCQPYVIQYVGRAETTDWAEKLPRNA